MRTTIVTFLLFACATAGFAQDTSRFRIRVGAGTVSGSEDYTITKTQSGYELSGKTLMKRGGTDANFSYRAVLTSEWAPESYVIDMTGGMGTASVTATRKVDVLSFAVKTPQGTPNRDILIRPRLALMDNMIAGPYQVLINVLGGKPDTVAYVIPFQLASLDATTEAAGTLAGTFNGKPMTLTTIRLKVANSAAEISFDTADHNKVYRVYVPSQDAEIVREGFVAGNSPQARPAPMPDGLTERTLTFKTIDGAAYPAVLCLPKATGPVPAVVMMQGSGPNDRDETIGPNKPFRDIAWGLAARGIATLRYDKRTFAFPKSYKGSLDSESIDDAVDAVKFLQTVADVDRSQVFVLGHSLGGLAALYVAQRAPVRGMVLMAAPGRTMDQTIRDQVRTLNADKTPTDLAGILKMQDEIMAKVKAGTATKEELQGQSADAMRDMIIRDPIAELQKTTVPFLVLKGEKDAQVFQPDFDALKQAAGGRPGSEAASFPNLSHIFTANEGPADFRTIFQPGQVPAIVMETIAQWIKKTK